MWVKITTVQCDCEQKIQEKKKKVRANAEETEGRTSAIGFGDMEFHSQTRMDSSWPVWKSMTEKVIKKTEVKQKPD